MASTTKIDHSGRQNAAIFALLLLAFIVVAICYVFWIPAGEGVDEIPHLDYILHLKEERSIPVMPLKIHQFTHSLVQQFNNSTIQL
jgi:hypothetical protein